MRDDVAADATATLVPLLGAEEPPAKDLPRPPACLPAGR